MECYIENITDKNGNPRSFGKYIERTGSLIKILGGIVVGKPVLFLFLKYNNGAIAHNHITQTSCIDDFDDYSDPDRMYLYTRNSIYVLKKIK